MPDMTDRALKKTLEEGLARLHGWSRELDRIEEPAPQDRTRPFPPATEAQIAMAERKYGFRFPPSYRAFLTLHNGWKNFSFDWWVLGAGANGTAAAERAWLRACSSFEKRCLKQGRQYIDHLRAASRRDPSVMYWPDHVPCAVDFNGDFLVFDRNRRLRGREYEVAEIRGEDTVADRLPGFLAFVERAMTIARRELAAHGRNPDDILPAPPEAFAKTRAAAKRRPRSTTTRTPRRHGRRRAGVTRG